MDGSTKAFAVLLFGMGIFAVSVGTVIFIESHDLQIEREYELMEDVKEWNCDKLINEKHIVDKKIGENWKKPILLKELIEKECNI